MSKGRKKNSILVLNYFDWGEKHVEVDMDRIVAIEHVYLGHHIYGPDPKGRPIERCTIHVAGMKKTVVYPNGPHMWREFADAWRNGSPPGRFQVDCFRDLGNWSRSTMEFGKSILETRRDK